MVRVTFVMEQHVGHYTYYQNLRRFIDLDPYIEATWVPVTYFQSDGFWERLTILPSGLRGTLRGRAQARHAIAGTTGDVLFFFTQVPAALAGRLVRRRPYVIGTDITPIQYDQFATSYGRRADSPGPLKMYKRYLNATLFRNAARLLPWTRWVRDSLVADYGVDPGKVEVAPPGVDLAQWVPAARAETGPLRILFVGGDFYRKGGDLLLRAFRALPPGSVELTLATRTRLPEEEGVTAYYDLQPNSPELIALFQKSDVFVLPTNAEAFGHVVVEASASGLPVIATDIGGLRDIVSEGETGFLLQPGDLQGLVDRLQLLARDPARRQRMGQAARRHVENNFDARRHAERVVDCLLQVAEASNTLHRPH